MFMYTVMYIYIYGLIILVIPKILIMIRNITYKNNSDIQVSKIYQFIFSEKY